MFRQTVNDGCRKRMAALLLVALLAMPGVALGEEAGESVLGDGQPVEAIEEPSGPAKDEGELAEGSEGAGDPADGQEAATDTDQAGPVDTTGANPQDDVVVDDVVASDTTGSDTTGAASDDSPSGADAVADESTDGGATPETGTATSEPGVDPADDGTPACEEAEGETPSDATAPDAQRAGDAAAATEDRATEVPQKSPEGTVLAAQDKQPAPLPAKAVDVKEGTYVFETNVSNEKVLDAAGSNPKAGSNVTSYTYHAGKNQRWIVRKDAASSWYRIFSAVGDLKLVLGLAATADNARNVGLVDCDTAGDEALWAFVRNGTWYNLVNRAMPNLFLSVYRGGTEDKTNVILAKESVNRKCQRFYLIDTKVEVKAGASVTEAAYNVSPKANGRVVAEVRGAQTASGANVWLYTANGRRHQKLYLERGTDGFYTIWVVGTRKVLANETTSIMPGNNVVQRAYKDNAPAQKWALRKNADGTYTFVNKRTGLALGATAARKGGNLIGTRDDGYVSTRFQLNRTPLLSGGIVEIHPRSAPKLALHVRKGVSSGTAGLILWTDNNLFNQRFELVETGSTDLWRIRTASSGGWVTDTGSEVRQQGKGASAVTRGNTWRVTFKGGGYCFVNRYTGRALDLRGGKTNRATPIVDGVPDGRNSQHFTFVRANLLSSGCYFLHNGKGGYLDIEGDSPSEGATAQIRSKDSYLGQYFTVETARLNVRIRNTYSDRYLMSNGSRKVMQGSRAKSEAQLWTARIEDGGRVSLVNVSSGRALDGSNDDVVKVATPAHTTAQAWKLEATSYQPFSGYLLRAVNKANDSGSKTGYLLVVDKSAHKVIAMTGGNGYWKPSRIMDCSVGAWNTPTVEGSFTVGSRGTSFGEGYTCWYWTQFYYDYLFHSVLYNPGSQSSVQDGRLGMHISHGCVRMPLGDAHWIYSTIPSGTKVLIYS